MFSSRIFRAAKWFQGGDLFLLAALICLPLAACSLTALLPSQEELNTYEEQQAAFQEQVDALPELPIRLVNNTPFIAYVRITATMQGPADPFSSSFDVFVDPAYDGSWVEVDSQDVYISAGGTVDGTIKCAEAIGISSNAPYDINGLGDGGYEYGVYASGGNIVFSGAGSGSSELTGDLIDTVRIVRPAEDGVDCSGDMLVIEITTAASEECIGDSADTCHDQLAPGAGEVRAETAGGS